MFQQFRHRRDELCSYCTFLWVLLETTFQRPPWPPRALKKQSKQRQNFSTKNQKKHELQHRWIYRQEVIERSLPFYRSSSLSMDWTCQSGTQRLRKEEDESILLNYLKTKHADRVKQLKNDHKQDIKMSTVDPCTVRRLCIHVSWYNNCFLSLLVHGEKKTCRCKYGI